ncbi:MAG: sugar transferase [Bacteroidetes bacterium]|nr:sugar transferase [Bacteroidota bacterium]
MKPVTRTRIFFAVFDLFLVGICTMVTVFLHDDWSIKHRDGSYLFAFFTFPLLWLLLSLLTRKFRIGERSNQKEVFFSVLFSNFIIIGVVTIVMVFFQLNYFSRFILFGTFTGITFLEIVIGYLYVSVKKSVFIKDWIGLDIPEEQTRVIAPFPVPGILSEPRNLIPIRESIIEESGAMAYAWIGGHVDVTDPKNLIISTDSRFNIINHPSEFYLSVVNLHRINSLRRINKFFETVNEKLPSGGIFIGCGETYSLRKNRILLKFPFGLNYIIYSFDFLLNRVFPKLALTNKLYFLITGGKRRVISRTETLGRLYSCGFEIMEEKTIGNLLYWKVRKISEPFFDTDPTYGLFIRLRRIGKNGNEFNVYKLRTMHAYAEFIQGYVYENHQLAEGGKFKDDFRVTTLGRIMRKFWLDELPMLLNVMKGEMKIVGVRPLSKHYFGLYSEELQQKRIKVKPGLIPPYYAQYPTPLTIEDVQKNEMEYLMNFEKSPFRTDLRYFFKAMNHIFLKRARSK